MTDNRVISAIKDLENDPYSTTDRLQFLKELGFTEEDFSDVYLEENHKYESVPLVEREFINKYMKSFHMKFCIKDIYGTQHPDYEGMSFIESFLKLKRVDDIINNQYSLGQYLEKLKDFDFKEHDNLALNRTSEGHLYVYHGNNRIILLKILYLSELIKTTNEKEKSELDDKYTFYADIKSAPKNKDIIYYIMFLNSKYKKNIDIKFVGENPDECKYHIILNDESIDINSLDDLKELIKNSCDLSKCRNAFELCESILENYKYAFKFETILESIYDNFDNLYQLALNLESINARIERINLDDIPVDNISFDNANNILTKVYISIKERQIDYLKETCFKNCKSLADIDASIERINELPTNLLQIDINDIFPNYDDFIKYYNLDKMELPDSLFNNLNDYESVAKELFRYLKNQIEESLNQDEQQAALISERINSLELNKNLYKYQTEYFKCCSKDREYKIAIDYKTQDIANQEGKKDRCTSRQEVIKQELVEHKKANILRRIKRKKYIKKLKSELIGLEYEISLINEELKNLKNDKSQLEKSKVDNEQKFQKLCGQNISFDEYEKFISSSKFLISDEINVLKNKLESLNISIKKQKKLQLDEIMKKYGYDDVSEISEHRQKI